MLKDNVPTSMTKGEEISIPVTVIECPPIKVASIILYRKDAYGLHTVGQFNAEKLDKYMERQLPPMKKPAKALEAKDFDEVRLLVYTQPHLTGLGKKTPDVFEMGLGGTNPKDKLAFAQSILGKEVKVSEVFNQGQIVDTQSVTKGKGLQGPVKRHGIALRSHKPEKTKRGPGSLGPWHGFRGWRVPHQGQMGFHQRLEHNKLIVSIGDDAKKVNVKGGYLRYGNVKTQYMLIKGSVGGASKRLVTFTAPRRGHLVKVPKEAPEITNISVSSKQ